jgi:hypothetical protein
VTTQYPLPGAQLRMWPRRITAVADNGGTPTHFETEEYSYAGRPVRANHLRDAMIPFTPAFYGWWTGHLPEAVGGEDGFSTNIARPKAWAVSGAPSASPPRAAILDGAFGEGGATATLLATLDANLREDLEAANILCAHFDVGFVQSGAGILPATGSVVADGNPTAVVEPGLWHGREVLMVNLLVTDTVGFDSLTVTNFVSYGLFPVYDPGDPTLVIDVTKTVTFFSARDAAIRAALAVTFGSDMCHRMGHRLLLSRGDTPSPLIDTNVYNVAPGVEAVAQALAVEIRDEVLAEAQLTADAAGGTLADVSYSDPAGAAAQVESWIRDFYSL